MTTGLAVLSFGCPNILKENEGVVVVATDMWLAAKHKVSQKVTKAHVVGVGAECLGF